MEGVFAVVVHRIGVEAAGQQQRQRGVVGDLQG